MKSRKKIKIITGTILSVLIVIVGVISFLPEKTVTISTNNSYSAIYNGDRNCGGVALTFNVYENTEVVIGILNELKKYDAKATFFVGGCWADDNAEVLKQIINNGHELGNHGYYHKDHKKLDDIGNYNEIYNTDKIVKALTGYKMNLFAPPSGSFSKTTLESAEKLNYYTIMWTKDTIDWRDSNVNLIVKRATKDINQGDIILMHPKSHTLTALPKILTELKNKGLNTLTVSQCVGLKVEV